MAGGTPRVQEKDVIAADYAPDGKTLAVVRKANRKVQLEYPAGNMIYATSGYLDYVRVSPSGKEVAFLEHPVYGDDRGWVSVVDEGGNHKQLTKEYEAAQGLAWSRTGAEIWFTAAEHGADLQLYGVSLSRKQREILTTGQRTRLMDIAADGRVPLSNEQNRWEITGIDPATGKERRGLEWFNESSFSDILPDGKADAAADSETERESGLRIERGPVVCRGQQDVCLRNLSDPGDLVCGGRLAVRGTALRPKGSNDGGRGKQTRSI
ncbi:MAG: hypothetical protein ABSH28_23965 [Acidobacteriota bacterium]|jgi:Tol biopolymer transport system component